MPELPEVETTRIGIAPYVVGEKIKKIIVRDSRLRWPVPASLDDQLSGQLIRRLSRRAKYLLFQAENGCMLLHLGMSGSLRILMEETPPDKHDHVDICFEAGHRLRFRDPRRFGSVHWTMADPLKHPLLCHLGPEPLGDNFTGDSLFAKSRQRRQSIKTFIMDSRIVVGVGNIYASEALFAAGIHPKRKAGRVSWKRYGRLANAIKTVLKKAIRKGGTTLRDFLNGNGEPGYFRMELMVYDRAGEPCKVCNSIIRSERIGQRSAYYCPKCQR